MNLHPEQFPEARQARMVKLVAAGRLAKDVNSIQANDQKRPRPAAVKASKGKYKRKGI